MSRKEKREWESKALWMFMSKMIKDYVFLIDKSISMYGREHDVLKVWRRFLNQYNNQEQPAYVTLGLFADQLECYYIHNELECVHPLTGNEYYVDGNTAFYDAVCELCHRVELNLKMLREDICTQVEIYIISDGIDNASVYFNEDDYEELIKKQKEKQKNKTK